MSIFKKCLAILLVILYIVHFKNLLLQTHIENSSIKQGVDIYLLFEILTNKLVIIIQSACLLAITEVYNKYL